MFLRLYQLLGRAPESQHQTLDLLRRRMDCHSHYAYRWDLRLGHVYGMFF